MTNMNKYDKGGDKKSMMFLDKNENKNQSINFNLSKFPNWRNVKNPDLANALTIGGATFLGSSGLRNLSTNRKQNKAWQGAYDAFANPLGGQDWVNQVDNLYCADGTCPLVQNNLEKMLGSHSRPDLEWFKDPETNVLGKDYHMSQQNVLSEDELKKQKRQNILKGGRDAIIAGGSSYLLNKALDNTKWGRKLQNKLGMDINLGIFRKEGGERKFGAGRKSVTDKEFANMSSLDRNRLLGISRGGGRAGNYTGIRVAERQPKKRKKFLGLFKDGGVRKYATAGMYTNAIPSALTNSTTNIVGAERDPSVLQQNQANINAVSENLRTKNENLQTELTNLENTNKEQVQTAADNIEGKFTAGEQTLSKGLKFADKQGWLEGLKSGSSATGTGTGGLGNISLIDKSTSPIFKPLNLSSSPGLGSPGLPPGITPPSSLSTGLDLSGSSLLNPTTTAPGTNLLNTGTDLLSGSLGTGTDVASKWAGFGTTGMTFGKEGAKGLAKLGAGAGKFLTSGAGLGTVASLAGQGIKKLSDDGKAHVSNVGEYSGSILSAAGTGASLGSMLGPVGTAGGAVGGALYGAGKQFFGTRAAKRKKEELDAQKRIKQLEYNEQLEDQMGTQLAGARMGEMEQKTYSGYDLGRNVTYAFGGGRMEMPRYY